MSLSGYFAPICKFNHEKSVKLLKTDVLYVFVEGDPADGHLLLDGGYINNLPGTGAAFNFGLFDCTAL